MSILGNLSSIHIIRNGTFMFHFENYLVILETSLLIDSYYSLTFYNKLSKGHKKNDTMYVDVVQYDCNNNEQNAEDEFRTVWLKTITKILDADYCILPSTDTIPIEEQIENFKKQLFNENINE